MRCVCVCVIKAPCAFPKHKDSQRCSASLRSSHLISSPLALFPAALRSRAARPRQWEAIQTFSAWLHNCSHTVLVQLPCSTKLTAPLLTCDIPQHSKGDWDHLNPMGLQSQQIKFASLPTRALEFSPWRTRMCAQPHMTMDPITDWMF